MGLRNIILNMPYIITGLGNPGKEYENTRHNTGRIVLDIIRKEHDGEDFVFDKKSNSSVSKITIGKGKKAETVTLVAPETFMNNSGKAIAYFVKNEKAASKLIVIYDDFNLPLGRIRISFNRSSGGHNGIESIIKSLKTEAFIRIRVGNAKETSKGLAKVPHGDDKIEKFILGEYSDAEMKELKKISKNICEAVSVIISESKEKAMSIYNANN